MEELDVGFDSLWQEEKSNSFVPPDSNILFKNCDSAWIVQKYHIKEDRTYWHFEIGIPSDWSLTWRNARAKMPYMPGDLEEH